MIVMLGLAFGVGGALFALKFGDQSTKILGVLGVVVIASLFFPAVGGARHGQLIVALVSAGFGLTAFRRTVALRRASENVAGHRRTVSDGGQQRVD